MFRVVVDANVVIGWLMVVPGEDEVDGECIKALVSGGFQLFAPKLLLLEILGILVKRYGLGKSQVKELMSKLDLLILDWSDSHFINADNLLDLVFKYKLTTYDAWYLQVALSNDCVLITHDKALLAADKKRCVTPAVFLKNLS